MRRTMMLVAALAIPVSGVAAVGLAGTASAKGAPKVTIECSSINGPATGDITVSGCSGGNTGGSSQPLPATALGLGGKITWVSGSTTTIAAPALTTKSAKKCPGYVKGAATEPTADKFSAAVTSGTGTNMPINGTASGEVCVSTSGNVTALKGLKIKGQT
jgi:hypothetical protein